MELVVATKNKKKLREIKEILKGLGLEIFSLADYPAAQRIIENGRGFQENAVKKAMLVSRFTQRLTLGEDSGLCVEALNGRPGVYSSRFAGKGKSDRQNNLKLLRLLGNRPLSQRRAHYICSIALADKKGLIGVAEGKCFGRIGFAPQGHYGFGYDPLFVVPKYKKTFGQLVPRIKHKISHRFRALSKAKKIIQKYIEQQKRSRYN